MLAMFGYDCPQDAQPNDASSRLRQVGQIAEFCMFLVFVLEVLHAILSEQWLLPEGSHNPTPFRACAPTRSPRHPHFRVAIAADS